MPDKSHVSLGKSTCPICHKEHHGCILIHKQLRQTLERETPVPPMVCDECQKDYPDRIAFIELDGDPHKLGPENVKMTGQIIWIKKEALERGMLGDEETTERIINAGWTYVSKEFVDSLKKISIDTKAKEIPDGDVRLP